MVGWHHRLNRHEFEQALGDGEGQGNLVCCVVHVVAESDMTEQLNNNNKRHRLLPKLGTTKQKTLYVTIFLSIHFKLADKLSSNTC